MRNHEDSRIWLGAVLFGLGTVGCMTGPMDGQLVGTAAGTQLDFAGIYDRAGVTISLQVLDAPDSTSPLWKEFDTAITSSTQSFYPAGSAPFYQWGKTVTPAALDAIGKARWPVGGLLHVRAIAKDPAGHGSSFVLPITDEDRNDCFGAHPGDDWFGLSQDCGKSGSQGAGIADIERTPADSFSGHTVPGFLTKRKVIYPQLDPQVLNTLEYYQSVGVPVTLPDFKSKFGFVDASGNPVSATYYNYGDLGIGREMHCAVKNGSTACYVSNFAPKDAQGNVIFGDEAGSLALATTSGSTPFATVAMIFTPPITAADSVKFVVYDASGNWQLTAKLDSKGFNDQIPGNCLACHGGASAYSAASHSVAGNAHFLPFDVLDGIHYGDSPYTYDQQKDAFRKLNAMVYDAGGTPAIKEMLDGMYPPSVHTAGAALDPSFVPTGWADTEPHKKLYRSVVAPYCRTCHVSKAGVSMGQLTHTALDWSTFSAFDTNAGAVKNDVCDVGGHVMPHAEQTLINFWNSPARAHLTAGIGIHTSCNPK